MSPGEEADLPVQCIPAGCSSSFLIALLIALFHLQRAQHLGRKTNGHEPALTPPLCLTRPGGGAEPSSGQRGQASGCGSSAALPRTAPLDSQDRGTRTAPHRLLGGCAASIACPVRSGNSLLPLVFILIYKQSHRCNQTHLNRAK